MCEENPGSHTAKTGLSPGLRPDCFVNACSIQTDFSHHDGNKTRCQDRTGHSNRCNIVINMATAPSVALRHFDTLYSKFLGRRWPSARLGLLSPKKHCLVANSYLCPKERTGLEPWDEQPIDIAHYYKKHLRSYHKHLKRQQQITTESSDTDVTNLDDSSDLSDGMSSAEDLIQMFSDRRIDDDEKYFINKASTRLTLNDYVPATELISRETITSDLAYYETYDPSLQLDIERIVELPLQFSDQLKLYTFPRGSWSKFGEAKPVAGSIIFNHYLLDGGSILPVLALDLQIDDECADYCAAPGGKSLAMMMTMRPTLLLCNDVSSSRLGKMYTIFRQYLPDVKYIRETLRLSNKNAVNLVMPDAFDKILVDVPCSNDRTSVESVENNLFNRTRIEERLAISTRQCDILVSALKSIRPNGSVVYSTCTMSPVENDGVVQKALARLQIESHHARYAVVSLREAFRPLRGLYKFDTNGEFGQLVLPSITSNFGPMYISKIKRLS